MLRIRPKLKFAFAEFSSIFYLGNIFLQGAVSRADLYSLFWLIQYRSKKPESSIFSGEAEQWKNRKKVL
jgi:hypothetical protein